MKKVLLEAPILTQSGYGEHSRLVFRSLMGHEDIELHISPLNWGTTSWDSSYGDERAQIDQCIKNFHAYSQYSQANNQQLHFDLHIHVGILNEFEPKSPRCISVTAGIETDRVSANWLMKTHNEYLKKIIVPSEHAKYSLTTTSYEAIDQRNNTKTVIDCGTPVEVVPYPVKLHSDSQNLELNLDTKFNFLSVAMLSPRKNMSSMIRWFVNEFHKDDVGLVLKTNTSTGSNMDKEKTKKTISSILSKTEYYDEGTRCKVYLLHGDLSEQELHSLYTREDIHAYLTTTHGEGYGLPIFEAAYSGLPIVATDWSGHLDFLSGEYKESGKIKQKKLFSNLDYDLKEIQREAVWNNILEQGSKWAFVKKPSFRKKVRALYKNYGMYKKWALALKDSIHISHKEEKVIKDMQNKLLEVIDFEGSMGQSQKEISEEVIVL